MDVGPVVFIVPASEKRAFKQHRQVRVLYCSNTYRCFCIVLP